MEESGLKWYGTFGWACKLLIIKEEVGLKRDVLLIIKDYKFKLG